jgi:hypothetical protein
MRLPILACDACAARRRRARVWIWLAYLGGKEIDAILYHPNPAVRSREEEVADLEAGRKRCVAKAEEVGGLGTADRDWASAMEAFWWQG